MSLILSEGHIAVILESFKYSKLHLRDAERSPKPEENAKLKYLGEEKIAAIEHVEHVLKEHLRLARKHGNLALRDNHGATLALGASVEELIAATSSTQTIGSYSEEAKSNLLKALQAAPTIPNPGDRVKLTEYLYLWRDR